MTSLSVKARVCIAWDRVETFKGKSNYAIAKEIAAMIGEKTATVLHHVNSITGTTVPAVMNDVNYVGHPCHY
jgi:hypothetical protein